MIIMSTIYHTALFSLLVAITSFITLVRSMENCLTTNNITYYHYPNSRWSHTPWLSSSQWIENPKPWTKLDYIVPLCVRCSHLCGANYVPHDKRLLSRSWKLSDIVKILEQKVPKDQLPKDKFSLDFGAADSFNEAADSTYEMFAFDESMAGLLINGNDPQNQSHYFKRYPKRDNVQIKGGTNIIPATLLRLLTDLHVPRDIYGIKIDIDSFEWPILYILLASNYSFAFIHVEINTCFPPPLRFYVNITNPSDDIDTPEQQQEPIWKNRNAFFGSSLSATTDLLLSAGYLLLEVDGWDATFIHSKYAKIFEPLPYDTQTAWHAGFVKRFHFHSNCFLKVPKISDAQIWEAVKPLQQKQQQQSQQQIEEQQQQEHDALDIIRNKIQQLAPKPAKGKKSDSHQEKKAMFVLEGGGATSIDDNNNLNQPVHCRSSSRNNSSSSNSSNNYNNKKNNSNNNNKNIVLSSSSFSSAQKHVISLAGHNFHCKKSYSHYFQDILVVMEFTIRLNPRKREEEIAELYSCFFPNIRRYTYCDPNNATETAGGMICLPDPTPNLQRTYSPSWFQYDFMADAMEKEPHFKGYLFMQEDVVVNFWNFPVRHNFSKVWRTLMFADPDKHVWLKHRNMSIDDPNRTILQSIARTWFIRPPALTVDRVRAFIEGFAPEEQTRLFQANSNSSQRMFRMACSDFYYIPAQYREKITAQFKRARAGLVFHEAAVPIIFDALLEEHEYEEAPGGALCLVVDSVQKMALYNPCWTYYHKIKISKAIEFEWLVETIFRYGSMIGSWDCHGQGEEGLVSYTRVRSSGGSAAPVVVSGPKPKPKPGTVISVPKPGPQ